VPPVKMVTSSSVTTTDPANKHRLPSDPFRPKDSFGLGKKKKRKSIGTTTFTIIAKIYLVVTY
jgi:hypothetical protein